MTEIKVSKATPSKAARELAKELIIGGFIRDGVHPADLAETIQSALGDLLEMAQKVVTLHSSSTCLCDVSESADALKSSLEPWKPGE